MKKREKNLITLFVLIPIICVILILIGASFKVASFAVKIILVIVIIVVIIKICITIKALYNTYVSKKDKK